MHGAMRSEVLLLNLASLTIDASDLHYSSQGTSRLSSGLLLLAGCMSIVLSNGLCIVVQTFKLCVEMQMANCGTLVVS